MDLHKKYERMNTRREARSRALQTLYAYEISGNTIEQILNDPIWGKPIGKKMIGFYEKLVKKTIKNINEFDELIKNKSQNWKFERITIIDKVIMRQALCEFLHFSDIPPKVSIDEAIEISKIFSTDKSGKFINGLLDSILLDLVKEGRIFKEGRGLDDRKSQKKNN